MRRLLALPLVLLAGAAFSATRHDISRMSCAEITAFLRAEGSAILSYRSPRDPSLPLYDLYVADDRFCGGGDVAISAAVPAADGKLCAVQTCGEFSGSYGR